MSRRPGKALPCAAGLVAALAALAGCTGETRGAPPAARRAVHGGCFLAEAFDLDPLRAYMHSSLAEQAVTAGEPIAGGDLPPDELDGLTRRAADAVRRCYGEQLAWNRSAGGQLLLVFRSAPPLSRVEASGTASDYMRACAAAGARAIEPTRDRTRRPAVDRCDELFLGATMIEPDQEQMAWADEDTGFLLEPSSTTLAGTPNMLSVRRFEEFLAEVAAGMETERLLPSSKSRMASTGWAPAVRSTGWGVPRRRSRRAIELERARTGAGPPPLTVASRIDPSRRPDAWSC
jgi:hypothetical protein